MICKRRSRAKTGWVTAIVCTATAVAGSILSGCSRDHFEVSLPFAVPEHFNSAKTSKRTELSRWWTKYGSAELNELMDAANSNNFDIAVAVAQLEQAEAQVQVAGAILWPTLNFTDNNSRSQTSGTNNPGIINKPTVRSSFTRVFNASYILDVWGMNRDTLRAAVNTASASEYQIEVVRLTTRAAVVNNFLTYAASYERVSVAKQNLVNAERVLRVIKERTAAGTASDLDVATQTTLVETQRAAIPPLRQAAETSRTALALLLGRPVQQVELTTKGVRKLTLPEVAPGVPSTLLLRRPDIHAAEEQLEAADANVDAARKAFLPTITLTGQYGVQSALLSTLFRPESVIWTIASSMVQVIFDGGKLRGQLKLTEAQRRQLLEAYRKSIVSAFTDVENALIAIRENEAREKAVRRLVTAARRAFALSEERLKEGVIDLSTLLTIQNTLFQAEDTLIQVRLARLQAYFREPTA